MPDPFSSDNAMRAAAKERGLKVSKDRDRPGLPGAWHVQHVVTGERLRKGSRDEVAAFIKAYDISDVRWDIIRAIPLVRAIAPIIDWPDARRDDDEYFWEQLEDAQKGLADFEPKPTFLHPRGPETSEAESMFGMRFGSAEWIEARANITYKSGGVLYNVSNASHIKEIEDKDDRRRALAEVGRLRFYVDYILDHRATWPEIEAEEKAIEREADIIAGLRIDDERHNEAPALKAKRHDQADKRETKLNERKTALAARLGVKEIRRYWYPPIREAIDGIKGLQNEIVAGHHVDSLTSIRERLSELKKLIERTNLLALDGDLRERTRKVRQSSRDKHKLEGSDDA